MPEDFSTLHIQISGIVQGVGFRPFVFNLAANLGVTGWVRNTSSGVEITATAQVSDLDKFVSRLKSEPPTLARIDNIHFTQIEKQLFNSFEILQSQANPGDFIPVSPDMSICNDCQAELFDSKNRRYRYPFINCTNCGPRFSIIKDIPYDRPLTTMSVFTMCPDCEHEYMEPANRRYHAQPTACGICGPDVKFFEPGSSFSNSESAIQAARNSLREGKILAIKGLGGFHLACDAANIAAVNNLHERKLRSDKPFALMCFDIDTMRRFVEVSGVEKQFLESPQHPILLLKKKSGINTLDHTAPSQNFLGFMLPYTPLHLLLLEPALEYPEVLVMTSGNLSEEPIAYLDADAISRLEPLADAILIHNRPIHMRIDDSVARVFEDHEYLIRRARGFAPQPLRMSAELPQVLSCGAELKNTFAFSRNSYVFLSHHIGDLENLETLTAYQQGIEHYKNLFRLSPQAIGIDLHPDYLSTQFGETLSKETGLRLFRIQHHHAHLASCLADNDYQLNEPVTGLIFDGTGLGTDGNIWGGEVLSGDYRSFERLHHLPEVPLPGGDMAIRNPARIALAFMRTAGINWSSDLPPVSQFREGELLTIERQLELGINTPMTTSMGRLFDAVSSLLGIRHHVTYEGQAAIELENICDNATEDAYTISVSDEVIGILDLFPQIILDMRNRVPNPVISARFHNSIANLCLELCLLVRNKIGNKKVALSGGVWQNMTLLQKTIHLLRNRSFEVLLHRRVPTNDGGISLGQTLITAQLLKEE